MILHSIDAAPRLVDTRLVAVARDIFPESSFSLSMHNYFQSWRSGGPPQKLLGSRGFVPWKAELMALMGASALSCYDGKFLLYLQLT